MDPKNLVNNLAKLSPMRINPKNVHNLKSDSPMEVKKLNNLLSTGRKTPNKTPSKTTKKADPKNMIVKMNSGVQFELKKKTASKAAAKSKTDTNLNKTVAAEKVPKASTVRFKNFFFIF